MSRQETIYGKLQQALAPLHLEVIDESQMHNVPAGAESHFKVVAVSARFEGEKLIARHRLVNQTLAAELQGGVHALALHTLTPEEWFAKGGAVPASPECMGGSKTE